MEVQKLLTRAGEGVALSVLGTQVRFLCEGGSTGGAWSVMEVAIPRDAGPPPHDHEWGEAYFLIEGCVEFMLGGETLTMQPGDFLYAPGGTLHGFRGMSETGARMLIFDAPAHAGQFFRDVHAEVRGPDDFAKVPGIGRRNGIRFAPRVGAGA